MHPHTFEPGAMSVADFAKWAGVSVPWTRKLVAEGKLRSIKRGRRRLITLDAARDWLGVDQDAA